MPVMSLDEPIGELQFDPAAPGVEIILALGITSYDPGAFSDDGPRWMS